MKLSVANPPHDPIRRLAWLTDKRREFDAMLNSEYQLAYFEARITGRLDTAVSLGLHSKRRILQWTRHENEARGRSVRWGDKADPTSTAGR